MPNDLLSLLHDIREEVNIPSVKGCEIEVAREVPVMVSRGEKGSATRSTIEGRRGCNNFVPVLGGDGTKTSPTGDIFDQPPGEIS